jgi:hypothetical protein
VGGHPNSGFGGGRSPFNDFFSDLDFSLRGEQNELKYVHTTLEWHPVATNRRLLDWDM